MALKILLADDSMTAQNMGKKILVDAGYDVVAVSNGAAAIKKIASEQPDIIILDVYMPGYTGLEVCERVKGASETANTPVLLTVGKMEPFQPEEANRVKADGVMIKPFEATDLIAVVQNIGTRIHSPAPPAPVAPPTRENKLGGTAPVAGLDKFDDTLRIPPPIPSTERIEAPVIVNPEATIRLAADQIRSLEESSYTGWTSTTEAAPKPVVAEPQEPFSRPMIEEPEDFHPEEPVRAPERAFGMVLQPETTEPIMSHFGSDEAPLTRAIGHHEIFEAPEPTGDNHEMSVNAPTFQQEDESLPVMPEGSVAVPVMPAMLEPMAETPAVMEQVTHELETSAPVYPAPSFVSQLEELEPTVAPAAKMMVSEVAPELEINSPIHLQENVVVERDPALVSSEDEHLSDFVTKFGVDKPEEVCVGLVSDLEPEQLAAITGSVTEESAEQQEAPVVEPEVEPASVMAEVGAIEATHVAPAEPVVAYVPALEDTQPIEPYVEPESAAAVTEAVPEEFVRPISSYEHVIEHQEQPVFAAYVREPEIEPAPEPVVAVIESELGSAPVMAEVTPLPEPEPTFAVAAEVVQEESPVAEHEPSLHMVEAAAAAAAAGAAAEFASISKLISYRESAPEVEAVEVPAIGASPEHEAPVEPVTPHEWVSDAVEPTPAVEAVATSEEHSWSDSKLSDAVAKAIENLKPQLITEILKQLTKK